MKDDSTNDVKDDVQDDAADVKDDAAADVKDDAAADVKDDDADFMSEAPLRPRKPGDDAGGPITTGVLSVEVEDPEFGSRGMHASLTWDPSEPFRIVMRTQYSFSDEIVEWGLARQLLIEGGGIGDVRVLWHGPDVTIHLEGDEGTVDVVLPRGRVQRFASNTQRAMRLGEEPSIANASDEEWAKELALLTVQADNESESPC